MATNALQQEAIESAALANELTASLGNTFLDSIEYNSVHAILMHWEDDDMQVLQEMQRVKTFFEDTWHFGVSFLPIPSDRSQAALQSDLSRLIFTCGASKQSLVIVYYGGHGDANIQSKRAIWAARRQGGPTLNWFEIQPTVFAAEGDVLMILDCCYAAQAARGREGRVIELLAASGIRNLTPPPGEYSFTTILMKVMSRMLRETGHVVIQELYKRLFQNTAPDEEVHDQPFHFFLAEGVGSIVLRPMTSISTRHEATKRHPMALLSLTISLSQKPDKPAMKRLTLWLKTAAPRFISAIGVEKLLLRTESIQAFLQRGGGNALQSAIAEDLLGRNQEESLTFGSSSLANVEAHRGSMQLQAEAAVKQIASWNDKVYQSMQSNILLNPAFTTFEELEKLQSVESARALGLSEGARLRLLNSSETDYRDAQALPHDVIRRDEGSKVSNTSKTSNRSEHLGDGYMGEEHVIIEYRSYEDTDSKQKSLQKVKRLTILLKEAMDSTFYLSPFVGYIHEPAHDRFGLVFKTGLPKNNEEMDHRHVSLYNHYVEARWLPLNQRFELAVALARALSALHAVGWLHKGFCSENILFFATETTDLNASTFDLSQPRLFGFDLSRPVSGMSDQTREFRQSRLAYTHPKRWGRPAETFDQMHDIYALGVTLLEVGCWRPASKMDRKGRAFRDCENEEQIRRELLVVAREQLPHMVGEQYSRAVVSCLDDSFEAHVGAGHDGSKLHKAFGRLVLDILLKAADNL